MDLKEIEIWITLLGVIAVIMLGAILILSFCIHYTHKRHTNRSKAIAKDLRDLNSNMTKLLSSQITYKRGYGRVKRNRSTKRPAIKNYTGSYNFAASTDCRGSIYRTSVQSFNNASTSV